MTRDEILQMEGEELAVAVAENVMGWIRGGKWWLTPDAPDALYGAGYTAPGQDDYGIPPFRPDLCVAHAWEVVEKLRNLWTEATDGVSGLDDDFERPFDDNYFFESLHRHADRRWPWAFLYVTPLAICHAALLAVMEE